MTQETRTQETRTQETATASTAQERALLLACLEWQVEAGCDGWFYEPTHDGAQAQGWRQSDKLARNLLDAQSPSPKRRLPSQISPNQISPNQVSPNQVSPKQVSPRQDLPTALAQNALPKETVQRKPLLAPVDAVVEAEKTAAACNTLEELEQAIQSFELCSLKIGARNTVFAEGNPDAGLVVVGEAPGREEDEQGRPFVGESGQLLARMLNAIGIRSREQYRITNLVYWRPPGNRQPSSDEVAVCYPFFLRHMTLVKPRWLLLLGNVAAQHVLSERRGITKLRGQFFNITLEKMPVLALPSFHPSYLLRTPVKKAAAWHDLLLLHRAVQKGRIQECKDEDNDKDNDKDSDEDNDKDSKGKEQR